MLKFQQSTFIIYGFQFGKKMVTLTKKRNELITQTEKMKRKKVFNQKQADLDSFKVRSGLDISLS